MSTEFNDALRIVRSYADQDTSYLAKVVTALGPDNIAGVIRRKAKDVAEGVPEIETVTAGQCSYFDNWHWNAGKKPRRGEPGYYGARHKLSIELWTVAPGTRLIGGGKARNSAYAATAVLLPNEDLEAHINDLKSSTKISRPWRPRTPDDREGDTLTEFGAAIVDLQRANPGTHVAPLLCSISKRYFTGNLVVVQNLGTPQMQVQVARLGDSLVFDKWDTNLPGPKPLAGNCVLHSRGSKRAEDLHWQTCKW